MKRSSDRVIKTRHKGLSRKEFNRGGVGIPSGEAASSRTALDCRELEGHRRFNGPLSWPTATSHHGYWGHKHKRCYSSISACSCYQIQSLKIEPCSFSHRNTHLETFRCKMECVRSSAFNRGPVLIWTATLKQGWKSLPSWRGCDTF